MCKTFQSRHFLGLGTHSGGLSTGRASLYYLGEIIGESLNVSHSALRNLLANDVGKDSSKAYSPTFKLLREGLDSRTGAINSVGEEYHFVAVDVHVLAGVLEHRNQCLRFTDERL